MQNIDLYIVAASKRVTAVTESIIIVTTFVIDQEKKPGVTGSEDQIDNNEKAQLSVYVVLGADVNARIQNTNCGQKFGLPSEPMVEKTAFGWINMSPGERSIEIRNCLVGPLCTVYFVIKLLIKLLN